MQMTITMSLRMRRNMIMQMRIIISMRVKEKNMSVRMRRTNFYHSQCIWAAPSLSSLRNKGRPSPLYIPPGHLFLLWVIVNVIVH